MFRFIRSFNIEKKHPIIHPSPYSRLRSIPVLFGVLLIVFIVYLPSLNNGFVNWDDDVQVVRNPFLQTFNADSLGTIFKTTAIKIYLPLTSLSLLLERHFFGENPFVYHLDNLILHLLVTGFIVLLGMRLGLSLLASGAAGLIFGLHPMHVESVAWVTERKDVLYSFFYALALLSYCDYLRIRTGEGRFLSTGGQGSLSLGVTFILGLLSILAKPMALSLPFVLLVFDWYFQRKISMRVLAEKALLGLFLFPAAWMTYYAHARMVDFHIPQSVLLWIWCFVFYIRKFFLPGGLALIYPVPKPTDIIQPEYLWSFFCFAALWLAVIKFRKNRLVVFAVLYYLASLFFLFRWDWSADTNMVADRFMYFPSLGFCLLTGLYFDKLLRAFYKRKIVLVAGLGCGLFVLGVLCYQTSKQLRVWRNGVELWKHQLKTAPQAEPALAYNKLGEALMAEDSFKQAVERYKTAKLRGTAVSTGDKTVIDKAITHIHYALALKPKYAHAYYNLGLLLANLGELNLAEPYLEKAVLFDPKNFDAYYHLGLIYQHRNSHAQAMEAFRKAVAINPDNKETLKKVREALEAGTKGEQKDLYL